jgi:hypothetical protein
MPGRMSAGGGSEARTRDRDSILPNGVAFTGTGKLVRKATGYEQRRPKPRYLSVWVRRLSGLAPAATIGYG